MIEESTSGPLEKMTDQEVPMYLKENVHSPHTNTDMTDLTNNNELKSTPQKTSQNMAKNMSSHLTQNGFINMEKANGHIGERDRISPLCKQEHSINVKDSNLDYDEDEHADLVIDEGVDTDLRSSSLEDSKNSENSTTIQALARDFACPQFNKKQYAGNVLPLINHSGFPFVNSASKTTSQKQVISRVSPNKGIDVMKSPNASSSSSAVKPRCAPVREAVDPAKYITVQEGDGVKYACSKCGNIYKWRKSLNKHWKEKHDGEIPEPRTGMPSVAIPRGNGPVGFRGAVPRATYGTGRSQVSPRSLPTSPKEKSPYISAASHCRGFPTNPFTAKPYASTKTFGEMSTGKMYHASTTTKGLTPGVAAKKLLDSSYLIDSSQRHHGNSSMLHYLTKESPTTKIPQEKPGKSQITQCPPLAHSNKPTPQYIPPRPSATKLPVDLSRDLTFSSSRHTDGENVLDLSKKNSFNHIAVMEPTQDEPLDYSKKTGSNAVKDFISLAENRTEKMDYETKPVSAEVIYNLHPSLKKSESSTVYACTMCTYVAKNQSDLELHKELHSNDSQYFLCAECHETCTSLESLNQHFALKHLESLAKQKADLEKENSIGSSSDLQNSAGPQLYKYLTMESRRNTMSCIVCGIIYQWQWALAKHFEQDHGTLPNPYYKDTKASEVDQPANSSSPVLTQDDAEQMVFHCHSCSFVAGSKSDLTRHQIRHSLNKHHVCKVCGYTAKVQDELQEHYTTEHPNIDPKDLKSSTGTVILGGDSAEDSDGTISDAQILGPDGKPLIDFSAENTAIVIPQAPEDNNVNQGNNRSKAGRKPNTGNSPSSVDVLLPYKCNTCEYRARWPSEITQHMKNHSDEKPFHCPRCTYKSKWKWDVVKHLKRCGGGTVKDVIDTTKFKKSQVQNLFEGQESLSYTQARELSKGPPNVTVEPDGSVDRSSYHSIFDRNLMSEEEDTNLTNPMRHSEALSTGNQSPIYYSDDESTLHQCTMCTFAADTDKSLSNHMLEHLERSPYKCRECSYSFRSSIDLRKHCTTLHHQYDSDISEETSVTHVKNKDQADESTGDESMEDETMHYRCDICPYSTSKSTFYKVHQMKHNTGERNNLTCKQCGVQSDDLISFLQHQQSHGLKSEERDVDGNKQNDEMNNDMESDAKEHGASSSRRKQPKKTIIKTVVLDDEDDRESDENSEVSPTDFDRPDNANMYICQYCPYVTNNRENFDHHMPHHEMMGKYRCEWCNWSSDKLNQLYRHVQVVHPGYVSKQEKEAFYDKVTGLSRCQSYSSPNGSPSMTESHLDHLKEVKSVSAYGGIKRGNVFSEGKKTKRRLKMCEKCGYVTDNVTTLQRHMAKHGKNGKYTCTFCDYSVDKQHVLDYHMRLVHAKELPNPASTMVGSLEPDNTSNSTVDFNDNVSNGTSSNGDNIAEEDSVNLDEADTSTVQGEDVKIVHVGTRTVYGCTKCPYHTMKISGVLNHSRQHGQKKKYTCTYCNYSVDQSAHVKNHMKTVHGHNAEFISHKEIETVHYAMDERDSMDAASNGNDSELPEEGDDQEMESTNKKSTLDAAENKTNLSCVYRCSKCSHTSYNKIDWMKHKLIHMDEGRQAGYKPTTRHNISVNKSNIDSDAQTEDTGNLTSEKPLGSIDINSNTAVTGHLD